VEKGEEHTIYAAVAQSALGRAQYRSASQSGAYSSQAPPCAETGCSRAARGCAQRWATAKKHYCCCCCWLQHRPHNHHGHQPLLPQHYCDYVLLMTMAPVEYDGTTTVPCWTSSLQKQTLPLPQTSTLTQVAAISRHRAATRGMFAAGSRL
jgi:hypothetical protein